MNTEKYYTPTIEEFHVGFEYEYNNSAELISGSWVPTSLLVDECSGTFAELDGDEDLSKRFRVKYLDQEDCKSLGFKEILWDNGSGYFTFKNYTLGVYLTGLFCTISQNDNGNTIMRFSGDVKNKSELKKLMLQLEI